MAYAILRTAKLKSFGEIGGSLAHTFRERHTPNADPDLTPANEHAGASEAADALAAIRERLPEKRRSDAVLCIEYFIGRSPEWQGDDRAYFDQARAWLVDRHGAENVVSTHVHRDEKTPHMVAYVVPRDGEKLNAKKWLGGKQALSAMQTDFWERVGRHQGLERGLEGSVARHQTVKAFYAGLERSEKAVQDVEIPLERRVEKRLGVVTNRETDEDFARRVAGKVREQTLPLTRKAFSLQQTAVRERQQAQEVSRLKARLEALQRRLEPFERALEGLTPSQAGKLLQGLSRAADELREASVRVIGWFRGFRASDRPEAELVELQDRATGARVLLDAPRAVQELRSAKVRSGDLVEVSQAGARILERDRERDDDRDLGR